MSAREAGRFARGASEASEAVWCEAVEEALRRGAGGLLFHHLRAAGVEPPAELRAEHRRIAISNAAWEAELRRLGGALREEGVRVLLIKGAALQESVYRDAGLRRMDDVDWVVRQEAELEAATQALEALGYERDETYSNLWARGNLLIDLHRNVWGDERVVSRARLAGGGMNEGVWARSRSSFLGEPYRIPAPEDHLLILCAHLMKHNFEPGIWFADLEAILLQEERFDWKAALDRARAWGLVRPLSYAFRSMGALAAGGLGGAPPLLPEEVRGALEGVRPTRLDGFLLSLAARGRWIEGEKEEWEQPPVANLLWLSSLEGLRAKARLLWEAAFPRGEVMGEIYPSYRPSLRWWFMARRAGDLLRLGAHLAPLLVGRGRGKKGRNR
ncbi:MAG: nucleotidyltransferase family protein [bacterium]